MNKDTQSIKVQRRGNYWGSVPQTLIEDPRLSTTSRIIAIWFCIQSANWVLRVSQMRRVLGIGRDADLTARRQLSQFGYLKTKQRKKQGGHFGDLIWEFDPVPATETTRPHEEIPTVNGLPVHGSPETGLAVIGKPGCLTGPSSREQGQQEQPQQPDGGDGGLIFPNAVPVEVRPACLAVLTRLGDPEGQALVDELAGNLMAGREIKSPARWLQKLVRLKGEGGLVLEYAEAVRSARETRAKHLLRVSSAQCQPPERDQTTTQPGRHHLEALDALRTRLNLPQRRPVKRSGLRVDP